ncbi:uncharacterized protein B0T23DRAFT_413681 [Neurospora hispaniola]|uniref:Uncharacterized protein n=1 Tax=Neurospora hispaniola TaxID=588809 RepID=A0AAJ0I6G2_9PEZI|nr:hypothetical protein B0T23DRAFT_413681 [Neurospora hispaniola]
MDVGYSRECCRQSNIGSQPSAIGGGNNEYKEHTGAAEFLQCLPTVQSAKAGSKPTPRNRHNQAWSNGNVVIDGVCVYVGFPGNSITLHLTDQTLPSTSPPNQNLFSPGHSSLSSKHLGGLRYVKPPKPLFTFRGNMDVNHPQSPSTITVTPRPWCSLISRFWKPIAALSLSDSHGFANHCHIGWARWLIRTPIFRLIRSTVGGKS